MKKEKKDSVIKERQRPQGVHPSEPQKAHPIREFVAVG